MSAVSKAPGAADAVPGNRSALANWWRIVFVLFGVTFGTNVFAPILVIYRRQLNLSAINITSVFAVYAAGLITALLFAGYATDRIGRRRVVLPATALAGVASLLFLPAARWLPLLYTARAVQGLATGAVVGAASTWLVEVIGRENLEVAARRASVAMNAGFALGPLCAGVLGQYAPAPTTLPFLVHTLLVGLAVWMCWGVPDTSCRGTHGSLPLLRIGIPRAARHTFWRVLAPTAFCVFIFPSVGITTLPIFIAPRTGAVLFIGVVSAVTLGAAATISPMARPLGARAGPVGMVCGACGFGVGIVVEQTGQIALVYPAAALLGFASGLCMTAGLTVSQQLATNEARGEVTAMFYIFTYLGFGIPVAVTSVYGEALTVPFAGLAAGMLALAGWLVFARRSSVLENLRPNA